MQDSIKDANVPLGMHADFAIVPFSTDERKPSLFVAETMSLISKSRSLNRNGDIDCRSFNIYNSRRQCGHRLLWLRGNNYMRSRLRQPCVSGGGGGGGGGGCFLQDANLGGERAIKWKLPKVSIEIANSRKEMTGSHHQMTVAKTRLREQRRRRNYFLKDVLLFLRANRSVAFTTQRLRLHVYEGRPLITSTCA